MRVAKATDRSPEWRRLPLCGHFLVGYIDNSQVRVTESDGVSSQALSWAFGLLADGQCEVLGVWLTSTGGCGWPSIVDDLRLRGLERVRFVVGGEPTDKERGAWAVFPGVTVLPSSGQLVRQSLRGAAPRDRAFVARELERIRNAGSAGEAQALLLAFAASAPGARCSGLVARWQVALEQLRPLYALGSRQRGIVTSGDDLVQGLRLSLERAFARHDVFAHREAVIELVGRALRRAERGFVARADASGVRAFRAERSGRCYGVRPWSV